MGTNTELNSLTLSDVLAAAVKPAIVCLLAGLVKFLLDYQHTPALEPALIDGALSAALMAGAYLGVHGTAAQVNSLRNKE